ncbi:DNA-directed RNA polymerase III subunit RPC4 [Plasmodium gonderi]|uniref:DNA-directed RNA polymerase III subunit RPC4 n=1 Tax=Plasmodium gonderi TaxID=77519 RepID=A0A1Y1JIW3_PLAGO|nr:DNA-directed RNA polymerase III subunit RPC4 [Plasmodium gonderi]GAW82451.1 DNA-directed RNA polymerase III subunit RPC4 [Plasmodium gonderi]
MNNRHNQDEYSLRRSINNTLRNKSNSLKSGINDNKKGPLKKFIPNIDNLKNENNIKSEQTNKLEDSLNNRSIQELITKTINFDLQTDKNKNENHFNNNKSNIAFPSQGVEKTLNNNNLNLLNLGILKTNNNDISVCQQKKKTSIDIYELNNISKNIFYNKKSTSSDAHFLPLTLPFFKDNEKQKKIRKLFLNKERFFFCIQLPNMLPALARNEEPNENKDSIIKKQEEQQKMGFKTEDKNETEIKKKMIQKENNNEYELRNISTLPNGKFAKLILYKNKKIKMKINDIIFDVDEGSECTFSQEIGCYIKENSEFIFLGNCDNKLVATPNIERIINQK